MICCAVYFDKIIFIIMMIKRAASVKLAALFVIVLRLII